MALAEIFTFGASHLHTALIISKAKPNSPPVSIPFFSHFASLSSGYPRNLLLIDFREGLSQPGWENTYDHKSHLSARRASCETLCGGKGLQVTMWKPGRDLHLLPHPPSKG